MSRPLLKNGFPVWFYSRKRQTNFVGRLQEIQLFAISWLILSGVSSVCVNWLFIKSKLPMLYTKMFWNQDKMQAKTYLTKIVI